MPASISAYTLTTCAMPERRQRLTRWEQGMLDAIKAERDGVVERLERERHGEWADASRERHGEWADAVKERYRSKKSHHTERPKPGETMASGESGAESRSSAWNREARRDRNEGEGDGSPPRARLRRPIDQAWSSFRPGASR